MNAIARCAPALLLLLCVACSHPVQNARQQNYDPAKGYRFGNLAPKNSDDVFVVLSLSGGGTRAAALSYGVLDQLRQTSAGNGNSLLDEVDVISSVSGGSFAAAYYGLFPETFFSRFESDVLRRNITARLLLQLLNPVNWWRLGSPFYSRIDLAADYYNRALFHRETFGDLQKKGKRPFIVLNATDMTLGAPFPFIQDQFDLIGSDLDSCPVARGVAASSAFPILLAPLAVTAYRSAPDFVEPSWVKNALEARDFQGGRYQHAKEIQSYMNPCRKFAHLLDGGLGDNIGSRYLIQSLSARDYILSGKQVNGQNAYTDYQGLQLLPWTSNGRIKKFVVIIVNAKPAPANPRDTCRKTPGEFDVLMTSTTVPMENYSADTVDAVKLILDDLKKTRDADGPGSRIAESYVIDVSFEGVKDDEVRRQCYEVGTNFHISDCEVNLVAQAGREVLEQSPEFGRLIKDLQNGQ